MKKRVIIFCLLFLFTIPFSAINATTTTMTNTTGKSGNENQEKSIPLKNYLGEDTTIQSVVGRVINAILGVIGSLTLLMFVYGGITWMTSSGAPEKVKKGRDIILWSIIGLAVIFFSYAMVNFVLDDVINPPATTDSAN